jgi:hypothetical protein
MRTSILVIAGILLSTTATVGHAETFILGTTPLFGCGTAVPNDGIDDTANTQCALNWLALLGGGKLLVPAGSWDFDGALNVPANSTLEGEGFATNMHQRHHPAVVLITLQNSSSLRHIKLTQDQPPAAPGWQPYTDYGFQILATGTDIRIEDVLMPNPTYGLRARPTRCATLDRGAIS